MSSREESEFLRRAEECLGRLVSHLDVFDPDEMEADLAGGVLKLAFPDGRNCIINRQTAAHQIWMAEGASAWHFTLESDGQWRDTKGRGSLSTILGEVLSRRLGRQVKL